VIGTPAVYNNLRYLHSLCTGMVRKAKEMLSPVCNCKVSKDSHLWIV